MSMKSVAAIGSLTIAAAGAYLLWPSSTDVDDSDDILPKQMIVEMFSQLIAELPQRMAPLMQQIQQVKAQNPAVSEKELVKVIVQNFDNILRATQEKLFAQYEIDESEASRSTHHYLEQNDEEVTSVVNQFRQIYTQFGGEVEVDVPDWLTEDKMMDILEDYIKAKSQANALIMMELQRSQGKMSDQQNQMLSEHVSMLISGALKSHNVTLFEWAAAEKQFLVSSEKFKKRHDEDAAAAKSAAMGGM